ncbi:hypothetical protein WICPIJ_009555 [Wickerhamomyces pijperi]|uniref:Maintenance of telomere capping protein 6 n=1 Tax=Wickerhamomyces pijperi TaxID=599730 RepID=A0A9P8PN51_WICPI|nr:hypothetical protein WICPIJ_009555 [Wickerhamomyces pijperi]
MLIPTPKHLTSTLFLINLSFFFLIPIIKATNETNWPELSRRQIIARRSQRDLSANISISKLSLTGVGLSTTVFNDFGYNQDTVSQVYDLLNVGVQTLYVDLYWNEQMNKFQLCPFQYEISTAVNQSETATNEDGVSCLRSLTMNDLMSVVQSYIVESDTNLFGDLVVMILNLYSLNDTSISYSQDLQGTWNDTLSSVMTSYFNNYLYTPTALQSERTTDVNNTNLIDGYPRLSKLLFTEKKRLLTFINQYEIPLYSSYNVSNDNDLFFNISAQNSSIIPVLETSDIQSSTELTAKASQDWLFTIDSINSHLQFSEDSVHNLITNGYSPILNHTIPEISDIATIFGNSLWSWGQGEPLFVTEAMKRYSNDTGYIQEAYKCASMSLNGSYQVANCYEEKYYILRDVHDRLNWTLSSQKSSYFHIYQVSDDGDADNDDKSKRKFNVPKDSLERMAVVLYLNSLENVNFEDFWIDLNSINVDNCWVTGGPYASCPYEIVSSNRNFVEMLVAASLCCLILFVLMASLRLRRVPIRDNRKHWKKLMNQYSTSDYDGVPS